MDNNFEDLLWQCGSSTILGAINKMAELSIKMTNTRDFDSCITFLDNYYYYSSPLNTYLYSVITSNYGANKILEDTINILLMQYRMRYEVLDSKAKLKYADLMNNLIRNKKELYDYEKYITNKKTR